MQTAQVFQDEQSQVVRLPIEFRFEGKMVYVKKIGNVVVLIPAQHPWQALFDSLEQFTEDYMADREQPPTQEREDIFA
jgi:antitoxin VapB